MFPHQVILHHQAAGQWLHFREPHHIVEARQVKEVLPALQQVEKLVDENGWHAAGFISYEAAPAFDPVYQAHVPPDFPLLWFGLFDAPEVVELPKPDSLAYSLGEWTPSVSQPDYNQAITQIKDYIARGYTYQVNYTLRLRAPFSGDPWQLFLAMVHAQTAGYSAWVDTGQFAICSASPELFFRLDANRLTCKPMKGTVKRGRTLAEDLSQAEWLRQSEKNRAENVMIVDMIRNDLGRIAEIGSVQVPSLFDIERYPTLWQMTSTVTAASQKSLADILTALFPCASITGAPKVRTTRIIAKLETTPRRVYTGCIGLIAPQRVAQFNVAIRTAVVDRAAGQVEYGVGGGIVWDSTCDDEYAEALLKARLLTEHRPDFSLLEAILWTPGEGYFLLPYHLRRLSASAAYYDFPLNTALLQARLDELAAHLPAEPHKVRLLVGRSGEITCQAAPLSTIPKASHARIKLASLPVDSSNVFLYHKTTHRQVYEAARQSCHDCDDVILWNERGEITESDTANVVVEMGGELLTPPVSCGLLAGTFRAWLLDQGQVREQVIRIDDVQKCDKIYLINSIRKWREAVLLS